MKLKLLKFNAQWCGPCKMQAMEFKNNPIDIDIQEIDIDSTNPEDANLVQKYKIMSIPNMVIINSDGDVQARFIGYTPSSKIKESIVHIRESYKGRYIVIEDFNDSISLVTDPEGEVLVFSTPDEAEKEAKECQNGKVVRL